MQLIVRLFFLSLIILSLSCKTYRPTNIFKTDDLKIQKITKNTLLHISYLNTENYGKVPCNGMVFFDNNEAIIFDTPSDKKSSLQLIDWVENELQCTIKGIVVTHFHLDCLGGLEEFHRKGIPSYAKKTTINLANRNGFSVPQNGFDTQLELKIGEKSVINKFLGEGHTVDNIVSYIPSERVLFGGCLVKSIGSGKGNLKDANVKTWSDTVRKVKATFNNVKIVVPGHGSYGSAELLDYTIKKFEIE